MTKLTKMRHPPSLFRVRGFTVRSMGSWGSKLSSCGQRRLIRLGGCPGWSESSLGAHSFCWFCHVVTNMLSKETLPFSDGRLHCLSKLEQRDASIKKRGWLWKFQWGKTLESDMLFCDHLPSANKIDKDANFLHFNTVLLVLQIKLQRISQNSVTAPHGT